MRYALHKSISRTGQLPGSSCAGYLLGGMEGLVINACLIGCGEVFGSDLV